MHDSLAWLRDPETEPALSDLLCGLIRDIHRVLAHPDLGNTAKLGAITRAVEQLASPPGQQASAASAAASVAALLARGTGPATALFEALAGERICIELAGRADRALTAAECLELRVSPGTRGHYRTGTLRTVRSGLVAAEVSSVVVPARLPASALRALGIPGPGDPAPPPAPVPLGKVLAGLAACTANRWAHACCVTATALPPAARAWSQRRGCGWTARRSRWPASGCRQFCQRARSRLATTGDATVPELRAS